MPTGWYLECTTTGTSGSGDLTISNPHVSGTVTDGTVVWTVMKNLPLSGGAMTGINILKTSDNSELLIGGASAWYNGAHIVLRGKDINGESKGVFTLVAALSQNNTKSLYGHPDGRLSWSGNDLAGAAIVAKDLASNGYIKFASGLILQWGDLSKIALPAGSDQSKAFYLGHLDNAGSHNALYRGCDLTDYFDSGAMSAAIADGTFKNIYPGDYVIKSITVDDTTYNVKWIVGDLNYHLHKGDTETTKHHVLMFPEGVLGTARMNPTNTTKGGYLGSEMWTTTIPKYAAAIQSAFGTEHVLSHRELLSNGIDNVASGGYGGWTGASSEWSWTVVIANLFNENMVYGSKCFGSSCYDIGDCNTQIAAMRHNESLTFSRTGSGWYWLRSVIYSTTFADAGHYGLTRNGAGYSGGHVRPYFLLT